MTSKVLLVSSLLLVGLAFACGEPAKDDTSSPEPGDTSDTSDTGDTTGDELTDAHQGWRDPNCWDCHPPGSTHNSDKHPYECAGCHGSNGASVAHTDHTPCADCHPDAHGDPFAFPDPESCQICHP